MPLAFQAAYLLGLAAVISACGGLLTGLAALKNARKEKPPVEVTHEEIKPSTGR